MLSSSQALRRHDRFALFARIRATRRNTGWSIYFGGLLLLETLWPVR